MSDMNVMNRDAPSSAPRMGRKESERNSKKESTHAAFPRTPPARAAALTSSSVGCFLFDISGRALISLNTVCTAPPMMTWKWFAPWGTAPMTPSIASTLSASALEPSTSSKRNLVAQWVRFEMLSGPPTALTISSAVLM